MRSILLLKGGHSIFIDGSNVSDLEGTVSDGRLAGHAFVYIQNTQYGDNGLTVDPHEVVSIVSKE